MYEGVSHPFRQLFTRERGAGGVIRVAKVNHICGIFGQSGHKVVFCVAGTVGDAAPSPVFEVSGASAHDVGVDIDGIDGVGDAERVVRSEDVAEVSGVAFCAIVDENLVGVDLDASWCEIVFDDGLAQELIAVLRTVAAERLGAAHLVHGAVQCFDDGGCQGSSDVTDAHADDGGFGVCLLIGCDFLGDVRKKIVLLEFQEVFVESYHDLRLLWLFGAGEAAHI